VTPRDDVVEILYDSECPVCNAYCSTAEVRADAGRIRLLDARKDGELLREVTARSLDMDEGMVVRYRGELYHGGDAVHLLASLNPRKTLLDRLWWWVFRSRKRARLFYPLLKAGRTLLLKLLRKSRINNLGGTRSRF
jgi:predicted DCC family thiol-disulfide oxidoreductase YuxK